VVIAWAPGHIPAWIGAARCSHLRCGRLSDGGFDMRWARALLVVMTVPALGCAAAGGSTLDEGGTASAVVAGRTYAVDDVRFYAEFGDDGHFRVEGNDAANHEKDCLPGLGGGLALYGDVPGAAHSLADLAGKELPFEFTGDGDDFNLCFVGTNGLLGVEDGTVRITKVEGNKVSFTFTGDFIVYDGEGGESAPTRATGSGVAHGVN